MFRDVITTIDQLREVLGSPMEGALKKELDHIDEYCADFISQSPFLFLSTSSPDGRCDVSPKGDVKGFVKVIDRNWLVIPDRAGNNRADSHTNIIANGHAGLLFVVPGMQWTLRVNGTAQVIRDRDVLEKCAVGDKVPKLGIAVRADEVYFHCPKCFLRSSLWESDSWVPEEEHPNFAAILREQTGYRQIPVEVMAQSLAEGNKKLW